MRKKRREEMTEKVLLFDFNINIGYTEGIVRQNL